MKVDIRRESFGNVVSLITDPELTFSYAQEGEDIILDQLFRERQVAQGFYVDVGAHHPRRFSTTRIFQLRGWRGINIDATPGSMEAFRHERPNDINLEIAVGEASGELEFYLFNEPALNTCDPVRVKFLTDTTPYRVIDTKKVVMHRLDHIFQQYLPQGQRIDFINIDVEGADLAAVQSNNWNLYRPGIVLLEDVEADILNLAKTAQCQFMLSVGYKPIARLPRSTIYEEG